MDIARGLKRLWNLKPLLNTRRNHAIEHATIHLLAKWLPGVRMAGRSTPQGFYIYGNVPTHLLEQAVREAIARLQKGESQLALHPHCGTNLVTASVLAGVATVFSVAGKRRRWWDKLLAGLAATTAALAAAQPLGYWMQEHVTTDAAVPSAEVAHIRKVQAGGMTVHFVRLIHP